MRPAEILFAKAKVKEKIKPNLRI